MQPSNPIGSPDLIARLERVRGIVRLRLGLYGIVALGTVVVAALLAVVALDWWLHLPTPLRLATDLLFLAGLAWATWYWVLAPLRARWGLEDIAGRIETRFPVLRDHLVSTVNFVQSPGSGSFDLTSRAVGTASGLVERVRLEQALTLRPLVRASVLFAISLALLAMVQSSAPQWLRTGVYRYLDTTGGVQWPRRVAIVPLTGHQTVAIGDSVSVRMRIARGLEDDLRGIVRFREVDGPPLSLAMQREEQDTFTAMIDGVTTDVTYWFEAGDDSTRRNPFRIHAVPRPEIVEASSLIRPPVYAAERPLRTQSLLNEPLRATQGSTISIGVTMNKPVDTRHGGSRAALHVEGGASIPLTVESADGRQLVGSFPLTETFSGRLDVQDADGLAYHGPLTFSFEAVPDGAPSVFVIEPRSMLEVTPAARVPLKVRVEDDLGVTNLRIDMQHGEQDLVAGPDLTDRIAPRDSPSGVAVEVEHLWDLAPLNLAPGDQLSYELAADDNFRSETRSPQTGRSERMRLKIISDVEFENRLREELAFLETGIRQAAADQSGLQDDLAALLDRARDELLEPDGRQVVSSAAVEQTRLARRLVEIASRFQSLSRRMELNRAGSEELRGHTRRLAAALLDVSARPVTEAAKRLGDALDNATATEQSQSLQQAHRAQDVALQQLRALVRLLGEIGDFHGLVTRTRDLVDRQRAVREETAALGTKTVGRSVDQLTPEEAAELAQTQRQQTRLAEDAEQLLARLGALGRAPRRDEASSDSAEAAIRVAQSDQLTRRLRDAAEALSGNRTAAAGMDQRSAEETLHNMLDALRERDTRELELLRKRLQDAGERIAELIQRQEELRATTLEAERPDTSATALEDLADREHSLQRHTRLIAEELADYAPSVEAPALVRDAALPMGEAVQALTRREPAQAAVHQEDALNRLRDALTHVQRAQEQAAEQAFRRSLARIRGELQAVRDIQHEINNDLLPLRQRVEELGRVTRVEAREAARLAHREAEARQRVDAFRPELDKVPVYEWALQRATGWMESARDWFASRKIDDELVEATRRIEEELSLLIDAIDQTQALPMPSEFVEARMTGGSGGASGSTPPKPVPTIAELLVLKAMQQDINRRTDALGPPDADDNGSERRLRTIRQLGEDQSQVRLLTERVTRRARENHP